MSSILDLPNYSGIEEGWDEASDLFDVQSFVNDSLNTIQTFFVRMVQLDPEENLMGETGRETNGFRLTTEDEPDGVDHDCFLSLRSDHIAAIGLQSGKQSPSISEVFFGGWDSTTNLWGTEGAIRLEATIAGARPRFSFLCSYGSLYFNNIVPDATLSDTFTAQPALTLESVAALVLKDRVVNKLPTEAQGAAGFYSQSGIPYAFDGSGNTYNMTSTGTGLTPSGNYTITGDWTFNPTSGGDFPDLPSNTKFSQSTGTAPFQVSSTTVVANLHAANSDALGGTAAADFATDAEVATLLTGYAKLSDNETVTGDYGFTGDVTFGGGGANGSLTIGAPAGSEAPITLTSPSTTVVTGLNADYLDGYHSTSFGRLGSADTVSANWVFSGTPDFSGTPSFTNGSAPFSVTSTTLVSNLNAEFLDGRAGSTIPDTTSATDVTGVWSFSKIEAGTGETIGIGTDASNPKDMQLFFSYLNTGISSATQTIETIATTLDTVFMLESTITAINACSGGSCNSGDGACYIIRQLFKNDGGTVTYIGALDAVFTREEAGSSPGGNMEQCEVSLSISGTSVLVQVTGIAGGGTAATEADIKWNAVTKIYNAIP